MVTIDLPATAFIGVMQARMAAPSRWTVQAPHKACPQPNFVPVACSTSRRYQSRGMSASPSKERAVPLTVTETIVFLPGRG